MNDRPQLSVILPAYNEEANIGLCIDELAECLIDANAIRTEIIVVNDNSRDRTEAEVLMRMATTMSRNPPDWRASDLRRARPAKTTQRRTPNDEL